MALFGKSFEDSVSEAVEKVRAKFPSASVAAAVDGKTVTLRGQAPDMKTKTDVMTTFNSLVETENTVNQIAVAQQQAAPPRPAATAPAAAPATTAATPSAAPAGSPAMRTHEVAKGETLTGLAQKYYGKASAYTKIFEANRDVLDDPDRIRAGQKLKIPQ